MKNKNIYIYLKLTIICIFLSGCSLFIDPFTNNLNKVITESNDPQTIMQALPAYIILLDGLIESNPENIDNLMASVKLMNAYSSLLGSQLDISDDLPEYEIKRIKNQQKILNRKSLNRAEKTICLEKKILCKLTKVNFNDLKNKIKNLNDEEMILLYYLATAWVSWIQVNTDDWNAMAQIAQVKFIMRKIIEYNESIDNGNAHVYLGVLNSIIPLGLGGKPEIGQQHFKSAIRISKNKNLMAKALYAEYYSRLVFDEELHKKLISEILATEKSNKNQGLINTLAIQKAKALQHSAPDYF